MTNDEAKLLQQACEEALLITNEMTVTKMKKVKLKEVSFRELKDMLDFIRVGVKYQMLDIEASVRERKYLEKLLKEAE